MVGNLGRLGAMFGNLAALGSGLVHASGPAENHVVALLVSTSWATENLASFIPCKSQGLEGSNGVRDSGPSPHEPK